MPSDKLAPDHCPRRTPHYPPLSAQERFGIIVVFSVMLFILANGIGFAIYFGKQGDWTGVVEALIGVIVIDAIIFWALDIAL